MKKRIMVDMSATLIHHGHIRILKKASEYGSVIVGLTEDKEIIDVKKYQPELSFEYRKEILSSIKYVTEVVKTPWAINEEILDNYKIDLLVHGDDNSNLIDDNRLKVLPRTTGVSSSKIRIDSQRAITQINNQKLMLTPGPAAVLHENIVNLKPIFGRGDDDYLEISKAVLGWIKMLSEQDKVVMAQGSATFALELAAHTFVSGNILLVSTGYYSDRLEKLLPRDCNVTICKYDHLGSINGHFDWVLCAYTETSIAFKVDLEMIRDKANNLKAKLYVDATGSIGLEKNHGLADLMAFSSCKGLFGLTGACFVAYKDYLNPKGSSLFYFNLDTHINKMVTGPYHAIASLYAVMDSHEVFRQRVIKSKKCVLEKWKKIVRTNNQPLLCTYLEGKVKTNDDNIVLYSPRSELNGSVICHFGEIHHDKLNIETRISIE